MAISCNFMTHTYQYNKNRSELKSFSDKIISQPEFADFHHSGGCFPLKKQGRSTRWVNDPVPCAQARGLEELSFTRPCGTIASTSSCRSARPFYFPGDRRTIHWLQHARCGSTHSNGCCESRRLKYRYTLLRPLHRQR